MRACFSAASCCRTTCNSSRKPEANVEEEDKAEEEEEANVEEEDKAEEEEEANETGRKTWQRGRQHDSETQKQEWRIEMKRKRTR